MNSQINKQISQEYLKILPRTNNAIIMKIIIIIIIIIIIGYYDYIRSFL